MDTSDKDRLLFTCMAESVLENGGYISLQDRRWNRAEDLFVEMRRDGEQQAWEQAKHAVQAILLYSDSRKLNLDNVAFYADQEGDSTGVTWRMLKIDMPYLRIVLGGDDSNARAALRTIIQRLVAIMNEAVGTKEKFNNTN